MKKFTKFTRKLMFSIITCLFTLIALGTSTFAWFSMNTKVAVTGMEVRTVVANNLLIAPSSANETSVAAENTFKTNYVANINKLLEPVSSVDGVSFFYNSTNNVDAAGNAVTDAYVAYEVGEAFDGNYGLSNTNGINDAEGYVDYAFQLKAVNSQDSTYYINITSLDLLYAGAATNEKAFRAAIFVWDMGADGSTPATAPSTSALKTILRNEDAEYFTTDSAVSSTLLVSSVNSKIDDAAVIGDVNASATKYFKVVIRLWLEGEDTTCNNTTFANLNSKWALNVTIQFQDDNNDAVELLGKSNSTDTVDLTAGVEVTAAGGDGNVTIDGVEYHKITGKTLGTAVIYTDSTSLTSASRIYTITENKYLTEVTNQCTLPNV